MDERESVKRAVRGYIKSADHDELEMLFADVLMNSYTYAEVKKTAQRARRRNAVRRFLHLR
jgi:hypothetical protein